MSAIDKLLPRLNGVRKLGDGKFLTRCPAHADKSPSLSIRETDRGGVLVHCLAGCSVDSVLEAVGLTTADISPPKPAEHTSRANAPRWTRRELFDLLITEAVMLAMAVGDQIAGKGMPHADLHRLQQAIESIVSCASVCK